MRIFNSLFILLIFLSVIVSGCAGQNSPVVPIDNLPAQIQSDTASKILWGYWQFEFIPGNGTFEIIPLRQTSIHVNVLKFLEGSSPPDLSISNLQINTDTIDVDVNLTHPFPGLDQFSGFDVRGIFIVPGTVSGYSDPNIVHSSPGQTYLMNADGWTRWWNPDEFPIGDNIFSYRDGKLGTPYTGANLGSTINAYKYFCDDLSPSESMENRTVENRGLFSTTSTNSRHYQIHFNPFNALVFNYAVDASWEPPDPDPPTNVPGDFPVNANMYEPFWLDTSVVANDLFYFDSENYGGCAKIGMNVHKNYLMDIGIESNTFEIAGKFGPGNFTNTGGNPQYSTYQFDLCADNWLSSSETLTALIKSGDNNLTYGVGDAANEFISAFQILEIPVSSNPLAPVVESIDPNTSIQGENINSATITGKFFAPDADLDLIDHETQTVSIELQNLTVVSESTITCDLVIPAVQQTGTYDVIVTNTGTGLSGTLNEGFTVNSEAHPWKSWKANDLNDSSSAFAGYDGPDTSPKWEFSAIEQGQDGCIVSNDGTIYFNVRNCAMYAVNPDGSEKWMFQPLTPWISICPALDDDGYVYTCMGSPSADYLYKVDPDTGTEVWSAYLGATPCYETAPVVGQDGAVYVITSSAFSPGKIQRVEPDGSLGWNYPIPGSAYSYTFQLGAAVLPNGNILCPGGTLGKILCFEPDGDLVWEYQYTKWILHTPAIGPEGNIYFTCWDGPGKLVCLNSAGEFQWEFDFGFFQWASPAVDPATGNIFVGDRLGTFWCFDNTGAEVWHVTWAGTGIDGTAAIDGNGDAYVAIGHQPSAPFKGLVKLYGTNGDVLWQSDDLGYLTTHTPSIGADGTIYFPGHYADKALYAWGN